MNATMTQNVVTYTVVVTTDNSSGQLAALPDGERAVRGGPAARTCLLVPNAALRWKPQAAQIDPGAKKAALAADDESAPAAESGGQERGRALDRQPLAVWSGRSTWRSASATDR